MIVTQLRTYECCCYCIYLILQTTALVLDSRKQFQPNRSGPSALLPCSSRETLRYIRHSALRAMGHYNRWQFRFQLEAVSIGMWINTCILGSPYNTELGRVYRHVPLLFKPGPSPGAFMPIVSANFTASSGPVTGGECTYIRIYMHLLLCYKQRCSIEWYAMLYPTIMISIQSLAMNAL